MKYSQFYKNAKNNIKLIIIKLVYLVKYQKRKLKKYKKNINQKSFNLMRN